MRLLTLALATAVAVAFGAPNRPDQVTPQDKTDKGIEEAGVCGRCHVISVVEWAYSGHRPAKTSCTVCHGESQGHVIDERNNIKPERVPHGEAVTGLCSGCHDSGCPKTTRKDACGSCHHYHALVDTSKPAVLRDERLEQLTARAKRYDERMSEGERLVSAGNWKAAGSAFQTALAEKPGDRKAAARLALCSRRLKPGLPGFQVVGKEFDEQTGLPMRVTLAELGTTMVLVTGGEFEMGSERFPGSRPIHTVELAPFYVATHELTQAEWKSIMGSNPSFHQGKDFPDSDRMPVESVSWDDVTRFLTKLNSRIPGASFRLPTEAEWEFAAQQGGEAGEAFDLKVPRPGGKGTPNRFGLFDLSGNVREWCSSFALAYPYNPSDGREGIEGPQLRVLRGGAFLEPEGWYDPSLRHSDRPGRRLPWNGLRLARSVPETPLEVSSVEPNEPRIVVDRAETGFRVRYLDEGPHRVTQRDLHYKYTGRLTARLTGQLYLRLRAETGNAFNSDHDYTSLGLGKESHAFNLKNAFLFWRPTDRVELQAGGIDYEPGAGTQATYADNDGWLEGYRVILKRPGVPASPDKVSLTAGYIGDFSQPNFWSRTDRLRQFNYFQILAQKALGEATSASVETSGLSGVPYFRCGLKHGFSAQGLIDQVTIESIIRTAHDPTFGWSSTASRRIDVHGKRRLSVTYSDIPSSMFARRGIQLLQNGDAMGLGKRLGATLSVLLTSNWDLAVFASRRLDATPSVRNRLQIAVRYQLGSLFNGWLRAGQNR